MALNTLRVDLIISSSVLLPNKKEPDLSQAEGPSAAGPNPGIAIRFLLPVIYFELGSRPREAAGKSSNTHARLNTISAQHMQSFPPLNSF